ncbi:MAG TPA: ABC transporter ATP-binding protein [Candidatus Latescibacteria bacterium]|nr:ABC transporter ATP-binding protein [Candidatus Latescibacterota bacterium]|tara:strand:- start:872 stop:2059 length:1188 start_codon:yes stop_codon:yes gene_type:complete
MALAPGTIEVERLTKSFRLYAEQYSTLKERALHLGRLPYQEFDAIRDIDFTVNPGTVLGLLGNNGSGKSTLLKCIARTIEPTSGHLRREGSLAALLELGAGFHPELTGRENIFLAGSIMGHTRRTIGAVFDEIVAFAELEEFIDNQVKHYSSGMYARLGFALAVSMEPDILLIDEILAVGDEAFQQKSFDRIRSFRQRGVTMIFVTHDTNLAVSICDEIIALDRGQVIARGTPEEVARVYRKQLFGQTPPEVNPDPVLEGVRFTDVASSIQGRQATTFSPNDEVVLSVSLATDHPIDDLVIAYAIRDAAGTLVNSSNSRLLNSGLTALDGTATVEFTFEGLRLLNGTYNVDLGAHSGNGDQSYGHVLSALRFSIAGSSGDTGIVSIPVRCSARAH